MRLGIWALAVGLLVALAAPVLAQEAKTDPLTAVSALAAAKKAAEAGDFDKAVAESKKSEELSKAAIFQTNEQKDAWKQMEIR